MPESFEAKKHAYRQTQDGIVISFTIHPNDMPEHLALAPLGTRFGVAVAEIGDDEKPKLAQDQEDLTATNANGKHEGLDSAPTKDRRPFSSLPLSQQAAIRCTDKDFQTFLGRMVTVMYTTDEPRAAEDIAAEGVRNICKVSSRSKIVEGDKSGDRWLHLEAQYQSWLTDQRYAGASR